MIVDSHISWLRVIGTEAGDRGLSLIRVPLEGLRPAGGRRGVDLWPLGRRVGDVLRQHRRDRGTAG